MVRLSDKQTGAAIGEITDEQFQFLVDQLEEEGPEDDDYYINRATLDIFAEAGGDPALIQLLRDALGDREDMDIKWVRG